MRATPNGRDVAYCLLAHSWDGPIVPPAFGCERQSVVVGATVTLVGFGATASSGADLGTKRVTVAPIRRVGRELLIGDADAGSCYGDSGGPAFIDVGSGARTAWRVAGVLSSGAPGRCGSGYYADAATLVEWLEERTRRDLTPCFDAEGNWNSTPTCVDPGLNTSGTATNEALWSVSCGAIFATRADTTPPSLRAQRTECSDDALCLDVVADDADGEGIRRVEATLVTSHGLPLDREASEIAPYHFAFRFGAQTETATAAVVTAVDHAGNANRVELNLTSNGGCSVDREAHRGDWTIVLCVALSLFGKLFTTQRKARDRTSTAKSNQSKG